VRKGGHGISACGAVRRLSGTVCMDAAYFAEVHGRGLSAYYFSDKAALRQLYSGCYADTVPSLCVEYHRHHRAVRCGNRDILRDGGLFHVEGAVEREKIFVPDHRGHDDDPISGHFDPAVYDMEQAGADRQHRAPGGARVFRLRQFFKSIPDSLLEAAEIDGAGEVRIFAQIMLPLCKPAMASVAIFTFINTWSDFMGPMLYLNRQESYTLSIGLQAFLQQHYVQWGILMAASAIFTIPMIVLFFFAQKYFIEGITVTGVKG
jgi:hypothetical protein